MELSFLLKCTHLYFRLNVTKYRTFTKNHTVVMEIIQMNLRFIVKVLSQISGEYNLITTFQSIFHLRIIFNFHLMKMFSHCLRKYKWFFFKFQGSVIPWVHSLLFKILLLIWSFKIYFVFIVLVQKWILIIIVTENRKWNTLSGIRYTNCIFYFNFNWDAASKVYS